MSITPSPTLEITPREEMILDIMNMIDDAVCCDAPVSSYHLAEQIVELVDEKLASHADAADATNLQGNDELMEKIVRASAAKFCAKGA